MSKKNRKHNSANESETHLERNKRKREKRNAGTFLDDTPSLPASAMIGLGKS